jgi:hypothetical protein
VINSAIAFFKAVQSVIEYVREILMIVNDYVTTLASVAAGNISAGAAKVERGLANAVPVAIGFLANQAGLGNVPEKLVELIGQLRELVDQALDWLFEQAVRLGKAALTALGGGKKDQPSPAAPEDASHDGKVAAGLKAVATYEEPFLLDNRISQEDAQKVADQMRANHPIFSHFAVIDGKDRWNYDWAASPGDVFTTMHRRLEGLPEFPDLDDLRIARERGQDYNRAMAHDYFANEVLLENGKILDSYNPGTDIVSRKHTQIVRLSESTWTDYLEEFGEKYRRGTLVKDCAVARREYPSIIKQPLAGAYVLEVAEQEGASSDRRDELNERLALAQRWGVVVRDHAGTVYLPE